MHTGISFSENPSDDVCRKLKAVSRVLPIAEWQNERSDHLQSIIPFTEPYRERRGQGKNHPVYDFLFTYYTLSTRKLEEWHPGWGVALEAGTDPVSEIYRNSRFYREHDGVFLVRGDAIKDPARIAAVRDLCRSIESRKPRFSCFGLHEWAMVYRSEDLRHQTPLRLSAAEIADFIDSSTIQCSHFDAFRFFTPAASPLNILQPTSDGRLENEQGGCIHANMDLFKWAGKLLPIIPSSLVRNCFFLALEARELDMKASPYDLVSYGFEPIKIETAEGRALYQQLQAEVAEKGARLRAELASRIDSYLTAISWQLPTEESGAA